MFLYVLLQSKDLREVSQDTIMSENRLKNYKNKGKDVAVSCIYAWHKILLLTYILILLNWSMLLTDAFYAYALV